MKISIVIPIYNVEPYIERCIRSVLAQTYRKIEVILVDDCTPDASIEVAHSVIKDVEMNDIVIKFLRHDRNLGLSAARNTGMKAVTGEYVFFLDSDDELPPDSIEILIRPLEKKKYDLVAGDFLVIGSDINIPTLKTDGEFTGNHNVIMNYLRKNWFVYACNKLYRTQFLKDNDLCFLDGMIHEDKLWDVQTISIAQSIYCIKKVTYIYKIRKGSISTAENVDIHERMTNCFLLMFSTFCHYQERQRLYSKDALAIFHDFANDINNVMRDKYSIYKRYAKIKKADVRSLKIKLICYSSFKERIAYLHVFLPGWIGYIYRRLAIKVLYIYTRKPIGIY